MKLTTLALCIVFASCSNAEYFSSTDGMKNLQADHENLVGIMHDLEKEVERLGSYIKMNIKELEDEHELMTKDAQKYVENPLNAFGLIKRLTKDVEVMQNKLTAVGNFSLKLDEVKLPMNELKGASDRILRLQKIFRLKTVDLAQGRINGKKYGRNLSISELTTLGEQLIESNGKYSREYFQLARKLNKTSESNAEDEEEIEEKEKLDFGFLSGPQYTKELVLSKACRGELRKTEKELSTLHCRYISNSYFSKIAPFKVVEANLDPYVAVYLDVVSDDEIEVLKDTVKSKLERTEVVGKEKDYSTNERVAQAGWQHDTYNNLLQKLSIRVTDMTGLDMSAAESWLVQNYGIGGFYDIHPDYFQDDATIHLGTSGNRIATVLVYLSDVELGGETVFPLLKVRVPPTKGAAVFWYNLSSSGHREYATLHAACPVVVGSKWVANKWIRSAYQEFRRPCELTVKKADEYFNTNYWDLKNFGIVDDS